MQSGSLVECINNTYYAKFGMVVPELNTPYTVRKLVLKGEMFSNGVATVRALDDIIFLNEIKNHCMLPGWEPSELAYFKKDFRELAIPDALEEVLSGELEMV